MLIINSHKANTKGFQFMPISYHTGIWNSRLLLLLPQMLYLFAIFESPEQKVGIYPKLQKMGRRKTWDSNFQESLKVKYPQSGYEASFIENILHHISYQRFFIGAYYQILLLAKVSLSPGHHFQRRKESWRLLGMWKIIKFIHLNVCTLP